LRSPAGRGESGQWEIFLFCHTWVYHEGECEAFYLLDVTPSSPVMLKELTVSTFRAEK
jgi:hypothetical protein